MEGHLEQAISTIDKQFGADIGVQILPSNKPIVMNKVSSLDAMYEIIVDGHILGRLRFDIPKQGYTFLPTLEGARRLGKHSQVGWISCYDEVLPYLKKGANLMLPGIAGCDLDIKANDEVWIINSSGLVIGVGIARMSGREMALETKGYAVKIREIDDPKEPNINQKTATWDDVVYCNQSDLDSVEEEAISFIQRTVDRIEAPVVVGFSGGKDSLVTYLLVEKALNKSPSLFFINTGLELPETVEHVNSFAKNRNAKIIGQDAGDRFWESLDVFGPPARDFRWCCKVLKLGPAATSIAEDMGGTSISFMGQRKLESFQRSIEPRVTNNPWVPGQTSANPIQNWNALEVWLYIFRSSVEFNPLYTKGYHRMGCYLCPSSPLEEIKSLSKTHPELYDRWMTRLKHEGEKMGLPVEWATHGFWRWKNIPAGQMNLVEEMNLDISPKRLSPGENLELTVVKGVSPCVKSGFSLEGQFSYGFDLNRAAKVLSIFGETKISDEMGALRIKAGPNTITLFSSGSLVVRGDDEKRVEHLSSQLERAIKRAILCQACGSCIPQCEHEALYLEGNQITVDSEKCTGCLKCNLWPCPTYLT
jgi:phosphoadenosine phosphosulfate reductase